VTRLRPAPDGAIERSDTPCVVGLAPRLDVRRNKDNAGTCLSATSKRSNGAICASFSLTTGDAGSWPREAAGRASMMTVSMAGG
jgi:hypothetical protein